MRIAWVGITSDHIIRLYTPEVQPLTAAQWICGLPRSAQRGERTSSHKILSDRGETAGLEVQEDLTVER